MTRNLQNSQIYTTSGPKLRGFARILPYLYLLSYLYILTVSHTTLNNNKIFMRISPFVNSFKSTLNENYFFFDLILKHLLSYRSAIIKLINIHKQNVTYCPSAYRDKWLILRRGSC